jgi:hypothetical protein
LVRSCLVTHLRDAHEAVDAVVREGLVDLGQSGLESTPSCRVEPLCGTLDATSTELGREAHACPFFRREGSGEQLVPYALQQGIVVLCIGQAARAKAECVLAGRPSIEAKEGAGGVFREAFLPELSQSRREVGQPTAGAGQVCTQGGAQSDWGRFLGPDRKVAAKEGKCVRACREWWCAGGALGCTGMHPSGCTGSR